MRLLALIFSAFSMLALTSARVGAHDLEGLASPSLGLMDKLNADELLADANNIADENARYVYSRVLLWLPGQKLRACFLNGTNDEKNYVVKTAGELLDGKEININFDFGPSAAFRLCSEPGRRSDVRISFSEGCCAAYVGRMAHHPDARDQPSVFLQGILKLEPTKSKQTVMHELIHALGFYHEHQSPSIICEPEFDKKAILAAYKWNETDFKTNLARLDTNSHSNFKWSPYDSLSIMKYFFNPEFLIRGTKSPCYSADNFTPSERDYEGLKDAYPITGSTISKETARSILEASPASSGVSNELRAFARTISKSDDGN